MLWLGCFLIQILFNFEKSKVKKLTHHEAEPRSAFSILDQLECYAGVFGLREQFDCVIVRKQEKVPSQTKITFKFCCNFSCLPNLLCHINLRAKTSDTRLSMLFNKWLSSLAAWALSYDETIDWNVLNSAIVKGLKKEDCDAVFSNHLKNVKKCHVLPWQTRIHEEL